MAELASLSFQHRYQLGISGRKSRIGIDIDHLHPEQKLAVQLFERGEHVVAEMAVLSAVKNELTCHRRP